MNGRLVAPEHSAPRTTTLGEDPRGTGQGGARSRSTRLLIASVSPESLVRTAGADRDRVLALADVLGRLPPIVVHRGTMKVIDGLHRLHAAQARGRTHIEAFLVDGDPDQAFLLAVELNSCNGTPLTRADRRSAVPRILQLRPMWSDRRIARLVGVSPTTVATVRHAPTARNLQSNIRVGLDGRRRSVDVTQRRSRAAQLFAERPGSTIRQVAAAAGISLATAHDVRRRMRAEQDPIGVPSPGRGTGTDEEDRKDRRADPAGPDGTRRNGHATDGGPGGPERGTGLPDPADAGGTGPGSSAPGSGRATAQPDPALVLRSLLSDPSVRSTLVGRSLLRLLANRCLDEERIEGLLPGIPAHRRSSVAVLARHCGRSWLNLAERIERGRRPGGGGEGPGTPVPERIAGPRAVRARRGTRGTRGTPCSDN